MKFYKKFEPLLHLHDSKYARIVSTGGRSSGKTVHSIMGILTACTQKKMKVCCFRESAVTIKDSVKAEIDNIIEQYFKDKGFSSNQTEITHANGSRIFFKGLREVNTNSIESLKGIATDTDVFMIDEGQSISRAVLEVLIPTLRKKGCVLVVCYNRIDTNLPIEDALHIDYDNKIYPENTYFVEVNYPDIQHLGFLSKEFLFEAEMMKKNKPAKYEELYLNKPRNADLNKVCCYFTEENIDDLVYHPEMPLYLSVDYNVGSMAWSLFHLHNGCFYFIGELCKSGTTTRLCALEIAERYINHTGGIVITGDCSGAYSSTQSEQHNYLILLNTLRQEFAKVHNEQWAEVNITLGRIGRKNPPILARLSKFNEMIFSDDGQRRVFVDKENCPNILHAIKYCHYDDKGTGVYQFTPKDFMDNERHLYAVHMLDAISYGVYNYWY